MRAAQSRSKFVLCVRSAGEDDLQPRKVYEALPDRAAARDDYIRVIDDSGEDYLYPAHLFIALKLRGSAARQLVAATQPSSGARASTARRRSVGRVRT